MALHLVLRSCGGPLWGCDPQVENDSSKDHNEGKVWEERLTCCVIGTSRSMGHRFGRISESFRLTQNDVSDLLSLKVKSSSEGSRAEPATL